MHVGHGRGAVFGDALANLLAFAGHDVTREYYINDAGAQVDVLARSAFLRYREALGEDHRRDPRGALSRRLSEARRRGAGCRARRTRCSTSRRRDWLPLVREVVDRHDDGDDPRRSRRARHPPRRVLLRAFALHRQRCDRIATAIDELRARGLVYEGRLPPPKGQAIEDWEDREQTLFRSTDFGDDVDRPLLKSDGSYTYFASDIAYHTTKFDRGFELMIDVWGADHGGYVKRMQAAVKRRDGPARPRSTSSSASSCG